jgi:hypothetical protein
MSTKENWDDESSDEEEGGCPPDPPKGNALHEPPTMIYGADGFVEASEAEAGEAEEYIPNDDEEGGVGADESDPPDDEVGGEGGYPPDEVGGEGADESDPYDDYDYDDEIDKKLGRYVSCR